VLSDLRVENATVLPTNYDYCYLGELNRIGFFSYNAGNTLSSSIRMQGINVDNATYAMRGANKGDLSIGNTLSQTINRFCFLSNSHMVNHSLTFKEMDNGYASLDLNPSIQWNYEHPIFVEGMLVGMLYKNQEYNHCWTLSAYSPAGVVRHEARTGYYKSVPLLEWPEHIATEFLQKAAALIDFATRRRLHGGNVARAKTALLEFYNDDSFVLDKFFHLHTEYNLIERRIDQLTNISRRKEEQFRIAQDQAITLTLALAKSRLDLRALRNLSDDSLLMTQESINSPRIERWYEMDNVFHFFTDDIMLAPTYLSDDMSDYMNDDGAYNIGKYHIQIDIMQNTDADNAIRLFALTGGVHGLEEDMQHPHVFPAGNACFGSYLNSIIDALVELDIVNLLDILIMFLSSCDPSDTAGKYYVRWIEDEFDVEMGQ
jgi:hypothetical protein